jgi:hypothetical protein
MAIDFESHGFDFTCDLCSAIESYTADEVKYRREAFTYRGMNLRFAVERQLYIHCINSPALFRYYLACKKGNSLTSSDFGLSELDTAVAAFLTKAGKKRESLTVIIRTTINQIARRAYTWLRGRLRRFRETPRAHVPRQSNQILIHIVNVKFARYLSPVTDQLGSDAYAYLVACDEGLRDELERMGRPVLAWPDWGCSLRSVFLPRSLTKFGRLVHEAEITLSALSALRPACVLVVEGNAPLDVITAEASRLLDIPCYCIQQGWSPYVHSGFRNMEFTEMLVWGEHFARLLQPFNPNQKFLVTGSHAIRSRARADSLPLLGVETISFFLQAPCAQLSVEAFEAFVALIAEVASSHPRVRLIVREHPGYPVPKITRDNFLIFPNIQFSTPALERLADVIDQSDMVVSIFSTVLVEAVAMNVVPLICSIGDMPNYEPALASLGVAIEVHSTTDARRVIDEMIADSTPLDSMRRAIPSVVKEFFGHEDAAQFISRKLLAARRPSAVVETHA